MGAAASTQSPPHTPREEKLRQAAAIIGQTVTHLAKQRQTEALALESGNVPKLQLQLEAAQRSAPTSEPTTPVHHADFQDSDAGMDLFRRGEDKDHNISPQALALFARMEKEAATQFHFLDTFCAVYEHKHGKQLPEATVTLFASFHLNIKSISLQPSFCIDSAVGARLVISEFGVLSMMCAYSEENKRALLEYVEYSLATIFDLPVEAVSVGQWTPGNVALFCCFQSDSSLWTDEDKANLKRRFDVRHRIITAASKAFRDSGNLKKARGLPVTFAASVLQKAWRAFMSSDRGQSRLAARRASDSSTNGEVRVSDDLPETLLHLEHSHEMEAHTVLDPWWQKLLHNPEGLTGQALAEFGSQLADQMAQHDNVLCEVLGHRIALRSARFVAPNARDLSAAGLDIESDSIVEHVDEFSHIVDERQVRTRDGVTIQPTTAVFRLRLQGLAAVLSRDLFSKQFDDVLAKTFQRAATVPSGFSVRVLGKRYGSVVLFIGIETCRERAQSQ